MLANRALAVCDVMTDCNSTHMPNSSVHIYLTLCLMSPLRLHVDGK